MERADVSWGNERILDGTGRAENKLSLDVFHLQCPIKLMNIISIRSFSLVYPMEVSRIHLQGVLFMLLNDREAFLTPVAASHTMDNVSVLSCLADSPLPIQSCGNVEKPESLSVTIFFIVSGEGNSGVHLQSFHPTSLSHFSLRSPLSLSLHFFLFFDPFDPAAGNLIKQGVSKQIIED